MSNEEHLKQLVRDPAYKSASVTGTSNMPVQDGKRCEQWSNSDDLGLMQQIGAIRFLGS